jgi:DNA polymerase-3 subunit gamma/tau
MAPETVLEHLGHVLGQENIESEPQALRLIARAARGSMRDALSLTDQAIAYGGGQLQEAAVRQMLGSADRSHVFRLIEALAYGDGKSVVETSEALRVNGLSAAATLEDMSMVLQRMAVLQAVPDMGEGDAADPEAAEMARLAGVMPPDETQLLYSLSLHGRQELGLAPDEYAALTMVLLRLLAFKPQAANSASASAEKKTLINPQRVVAAPASPASPASAPAASVVKPAPVAAQPFVQAPATQVPSAPPVVAQRQPEPQPAAPVQALPVRDMQPREVAPWEDDPSYDPDGSDSPSYDHDSDAAVVAMPVRQQAEPSAALELQIPTTEVPQIVATPEGEFWHKLVMDMSAAETINALVRELGLQSQLVARDTDTWLLRVERESLNSSTSRERLQKALETAGYPVRLAVEVGRVQDSPAKRNAAAAAQRQAGAEAIILSDTYVQSLMRDYGAKIVPGSIKPL